MKDDDNKTISFEGRVIAQADGGNVELSHGGRKVAVSGLGSDLYAFKFNQSYEVTFAPIEKAECCALCDSRLDFNRIVIRKQGGRAEICHNCDTKSAFELWRLIDARRAGESGPPNKCPQCGAVCGDECAGFGDHFEMDCAACNSSWVYLPTGADDGSYAWHRTKAELSGSEALYGFVSWLTARHRALTLSRHHNVDEATDLIELFCKTNGLADPRGGWEKHLSTHPSEPDLDDE